MGRARSPLRRHAIEYRRAHPAQTVDLLTTNTGVPRAVWEKALPRLEWGATYPIDDQVIKAQQDAADLAFRNKVIPRAVDVRQAVVDIR